MRNKIKRIVPFVKPDTSMTKTDYNIIKTLMKMYNRRYRDIVMLYNECDRSLSKTTETLNLTSIKTK